MSTAREKTEGGHQKVVYLGAREAAILQHAACALGTSHSAALRAILRDYAERLAERTDEQPQRAA